MKQKKYIHKKDKILNKKIVFCTECGEELETFGIEGVDVEKTKERYNRCREKGKFNGDKCAMLYIAQSNEESFNDESLDTDL